MAPRLVQNFRGLQAVWWGAPGTCPDALRATLGRLGLSLVQMEGSGPACLSADSHVLFIDGDLPFDAARFGRPGRILPVVPAIGLVGVEAPSRLRALSDAGVTAFLRKPVHPATVYSSLFLAVNAYARFAQLETELAEHHRRRNGRRFVVKAVVDLVLNAGMSDDDAYTHIRREAMRRRVAVEEYAEALVAARGDAAAVCDDHLKQEASNG
jgi:hypothetical protein